MWPIAPTTYHRHHHSRQDGHRPQVVIREILSQNRSVLQRCDRAKHTANQTACEKVATIPSQKLKSRDESDEGSEKEAATEAYPLLERVWWFHRAICRLTVKLRGRPMPQAALRSNEAL